MLYLSRQLENRFEEILPVAGRLISGSDDLSKSMLDLLSEPVAILSERKRFIFRNKAWYQLLGSDTETSVSTVAQWMDGGERKGA